MSSVAVGLPHAGCHGEAAKALLDKTICPRCKTLSPHMALKQAHCHPSCQPRERCRRGMLVSSRIFVGLAVWILYGFIVPRLLLSGRNV